MPTLLVRGWRLHFAGGGHTALPHSSPRNMWNPRCVSIGARQRQSSPSIQGVTGKILLYGYDNDHRPSLYMLPSRQNTDGPERQIQYTVWNIERAIDLMEQGTERCDADVNQDDMTYEPPNICVTSLVLLIDFSDKAKNPSIATARTVSSSLSPSLAIL